MHRRLICAAALAAACARAAAPPAAPPPPAAAPVPVPVAPTPAPPARGNDVIRFGPSALRYLVHRRIHVAQQVRGQTVTLDRGVRAYVAATIMPPADSVGYVVTLTIDSLVADSGTALPAGINLAAVWALRYVGRLSPSGALRNLFPSDSVLAGTAAQVFGSFQGFYPRIPAGGLALGADWSDTASSVDRGVVEMTTKSVNRSRAVTWEQRGDTRCLRIDVISGFTLSGGGLMGGQRRQVSGSGSRVAFQFLAVDGRYFGGEVRDSMAITTTFPDEGETVPGTQISQIIVTVLR